MPLTTKKIGMRNPNPMASSFPRTTALSATGREQSDHDAGGERPEQDVEPQGLRQQHQQHDEEEGHPDRKLGARLEVPV